MGDLAGRVNTRPYSAREGGWASARLYAILLLGALTGCNWYYDKLPSPDDLVKLVPWFDHMITSPVPHPYERADLPRRTPPGAVPVTGGEPEWGTGDPSKLSYGYDTLVANRLVNPSNRAATLALGDTVYGNFCATCHGATGDGRGPVGVRMGAASLLTDKAKALSDGHIYGIVRYGRGVMPQYGDKIFRPADRWAVVNYVRSLQGFPIGPAPAATAPPPASPARPGGSQ